jgi:phage gp46-like protein
MSDVALINDTGFKFDLRLKNGDVEFDEGLETALSISLFSDRRVTEEELPQGAESRKGWWGDMVPDVDQDKIGSKLWTLARSKRTLETLRRTEDYAREALQWLLEDGVASNVAVTAEFHGDVSEGRWVLGVVISRPSGEDSRFQVLWDEQKIKRG